jgi:hypothetical protein
MVVAISNNIRGEVILICYKHIHKTKRLTSHGKPFFLKKTDNQIY